MSRVHMRRAFGLAVFFAASPAFAGSAPEKARLCESCHGPAGNSVTPGTPSIAAQPETFLENQLIFMREGLRNAPVMQEIAKGMKDEDITALARHFSSQKGHPVGAAPADEELAGRGAALASRLHCGQCHLPKLQGRAQMPRLAGQREDYLVEAMRGYREGTRTGADTTMSEVLYGLSDADIKALAHYIARVE